MQPILYSKNIFQAKGAAYALMGKSWLEKRRQKYNENEKTKLKSRKALHLFHVTKGSIISNHTLKRTMLIYFSYTFVSS